jgi:ssDNA-binding Zn-finger/Zn-ribbon topoisomerase 1
MKKKTKRPNQHCEDCDDQGWLVFSDDTVQRCDGCQRYPDDLKAAIAFFKSKEGKKRSLKEVKLETQTKPTPTLTP